MTGQMNLEQRTTWLLGLLDQAVTTAIAELARQVPEGASPVDADNPLVLWTQPEKRREDLFANLLAEVKRRQEGGAERESAAGLPQIAADDLIHRVLARLIMNDEPQAVVVGEEALPEDWDAWAAASPGTVVYSLDSVDGSSPYDSLSFGFSTNMLMYVRQADGTDALVMSIVMNSSGLALVYQAPNSVYVAHAGERRQIIEPGVGPDDVRPGFAAVVGAMPNARRRSAEILDTTTSWNLPPLRSGGKEEADPPLTVFTAGGAPATWGIAMGRLDAFVCTEPQTVHDTAGIPALLALGLKAYGDGGVQLDSKSLRLSFNGLARPKSANYRPIPRLVIARDDALARLIASRLFQRPFDGPQPALCAFGPLD